MASKFNLGDTKMKGHEIQVIIYIWKLTPIEERCYKKCRSPWNSTITGKIRMCVDTRQLNDVTEHVSFPSPIHSYTIPSCLTKF